MTPRSLFNIVLKVIGLFFFKDFILLVPQSFIVIMSKSDSKESGWIILSTVVILIIEFLICFYLIFKTDVIIKKLNLESGLEKGAIQINMNPTTTLRVAIIVIGVLLLTEEIPNFCRQLFLYFRVKELPFLQNNRIIENLLLSGITILIGFLLIGEQKRIVRLVDREKKK